LLDPGADGAFAEEQVSGRATESRGAQGQPEEGVFSWQELTEKRQQRIFPAAARQAAFLLGGLGTGNVSVGSRGELRDWELFNKPGKANDLGYSFFAIWAKKEHAEPVARILEARIPPPYNAARGFNSEKMAGIPRLEGSSLRGEYPFVWVDFSDPQLPVEVTLEAFTPFIPLNADESGIPGAVIRYVVRNAARSPVDVTVLGSLINAVGFDGFDVYGNIQFLRRNCNEYREAESLRGIYYTSPELEPEHPLSGSLALATRDAGVTHKARWLEGSWYDGAQDFWDDFRADGRLEPCSVFDAPGGDILRRTMAVGSLGITSRLEPGEEKTCEFFLTWYFPNRIRGWTAADYEATKEIVKNYYATLFTDAWDAARYLAVNLDRLEKHSRDFHRALFSSTLPWYVVEALANNITVIRSPTCFRIADGTFLAWEGCHEQEGSCQGNCTHVWSYAQTLAFLFPELEHTMRRVEFNLETDDQGRMAFRSRRVFGLDSWDYRPAADGQLGCVIRLYRDWKLSGSDDLLEEVWEKAVRALDFAFSYWDRDGDCVLDSEQHNTYDIEFFGISSMTNSMFLAALRAAEELAEHRGERERARRYRDAFDRGSRSLDSRLWNGEYYAQELAGVDRYRYQYGVGCLSDQLLGQYHAHAAGLGYILPEDHVRKAVEAVFRNNFRADLREHQSVQRTFALNDEKGLVLCSWPHGGRPRLPFVYCDEVWTGVEYEVASLLIFEGFLKEGLTVIRALRERFDGIRRNPWSEEECGHHYARSLASWALLIALSGFRYDLVHKEISFSPKIGADDFSCFFSTGRAWGIYHQKIDPASGRTDRGLEVLYGDTSTESYLR
jgi:non-lysosomal glucosylceramidase